MLDADFIEDVVFEPEAPLVTRIGRGEYDRIKSALMAT